MTIKYVTNGPHGTGLARVLTAAECDSNIFQLVGQIAAAVAGGIEGVSITNVTVTGRYFTVYLSDATTRGPFEIPTSVPHWRDEWTAGAGYFDFDFVKVSGQGIYAVLQDHTAGATFSSTDGNTSGDYYVLIYPDILTAPVLTISASTLTPTRSNVAKYHRCTHASGCIVTVPSGVFAVNDEMHFRQTQAAISFFADDTGVSLTGVDGYENKTGRVGAVVTLKCVAADTFDLFGFLSETYT